MNVNEIRAEAVREATRYLERIHKRGLRNRDDILADLDSVAFRMEQGMTARGNIRTTQPSDPSPAERDGESPCPMCNDTGWQNGYLCPLHNGERGPYT